MECIFNEECEYCTDEIHHNSTTNTYTHDDTNSTTNKEHNFNHDKTNRTGNTMEHEARLFCIATDIVERRSG